MPVCMALIGDSFALSVRQVALSRYIAATLVGQLVGVSAGGLIAEWIGWRGVLKLSQYWPQLLPWPRFRCSRKRAPVQPLHSG